MNGNESTRYEDKETRYGDTGTSDEELRFLTRLLIKSPSMPVVIGVSKIRQRDVNVYARRHSKSTKNYCKRERVNK